MNPRLIILIPLIIIVASCTWFTSDFDPPVTTDFDAILFQPMQQAFNVASAADLSGVMSFYDDDYLHNNQIKSAREIFFRSMFDATDSPQFIVTFLAGTVENDTLANTNWRLRIYAPESKALLADSTFTGEKLIKRDGVWKLWGNRISCFNPPARQRAILESITYVGCPNCPPVEQALHDLQMLYPLDVFFLEYHVAGPFDSGAQDVYGYYGYPAMPTVVVQGMNRLIGNSTENLALYQTLAQNIIQSNTEILLTDLVNTYTPGTGIAGSIRVTPVNDGFETQDLRLKYVILERERNYGNPPHTYRNVVMRKGEMDISTSDLSQPLSFSLPYQGSLPDDAHLLVWVQRVPSTFASNARIFNGLEVPVLTR